ncbi:MAG: Obg family GTPase CgtA [Legionellales bacterium]|jgi:GTPase|nr:Obg family GTPase CgtA [Legionellales bacterium]
MKFIDEVNIEATAGSGGRGCSSFRREKYIPFGGPDGGNGGRGGSVFLVGDSSLNNLLELRNKRFFKADSGSRGTPKLCHGKYGLDLFVKVPLGTKIHDADTGEFIADVTADDAQICVAVGADGGFGNAHFKSSTNRAPRRTTLGFPGEHRKLRLELSILADVGLLGMPNAGKSTLLRKISQATPKVADYPFTTLRPHLGVVQADYDKVFTVADIPGLIEGAAAGIGLGVRFLKHLSRCRLLLHLVDVASGDDIFDNIIKIRKELAGYSADITAKPCWLIFNKCDAMLDEQLDKIIADVNSRLGYDGKFYIISGISGVGVDVLINDIAAWLEINKST